MLLSKFLDQESSDRLYVKMITLGDDEDVILQCEVINSEMKGIFISGDFSLIDGHIYFNNNVIKLRYDLMRVYGHRNDLQNNFFNKYTDVLNLNEGDSIKTTCPIDSP